MKAFIVLFAFVALCAAQDQGAAQKKMLELHNAKRAIHKTGAMKQSNDLNTWAVQCAKYYAGINKIDHSCPYKNGAGENLGQVGFNGSPNYIVGVETTEKMWYDEKAGYNYQNPDKSTGVTGHFTQEVWADSKELGTGVASNDKWMFVVSLYRKAGNMQWGGAGDKYQFYKKNVISP